MDEKFIVKTKKFNTWIRSELRFLPEGISIVNEYKSILIKYNELTGLNLDDNLFLTLVYTKMTPSGKFFGNEQIECNETIIKEIKKRTKTKITKVQNPKNGLLRDSVILVGKCRYGFNQDEYQFYLTHKKIILISQINQIVFNLANIETIERGGQSGIKILYEQKFHDIFALNVDQLIQSIEQAKVYANNYDDNVNLEEFTKKSKKEIKPNYLFIVLGIIIIFILYILYNLI